jgi:hypothetical protein
VKTLEGHASTGGPSRIVGFSPRYAMFVTGGTELAFWLPENKDSAPTATGVETTKLVAAAA